ncbi:type II secretion system protein [Legionella maioricensis]|uniref:Type II secretion system protein n=1 Tax=Legionella maioricensis TaxID=2896528 RepID=A0A9X2CXT1_9GAMM|nr:type II secretion system protein [Legionella maioricensis]MCL9682721.1 type II secretion system protein [Legionella maioricensis]MCL9687231.1 type II secretion system protein [Legionella maioricensis]
MKKQCSGFIFLMTLCVILVISLLLITGLHHVLLYHKALNQQELQHQHFYQLEHLAVQLAHIATGASAKSCVEYGDAANEVIQRLIENQGCSLTDGQARYRYLIEDLGDFPCLVFPGQNRASRHFRITLLLLKDDENSASVLQLRMIKPSGMIRCSGEERAVTEGISSWRYIPAV